MQTKLRYDLYVDNYQRWQPKIISLGAPRTCWTMWKPCYVMANLKMARTLHVVLLADSSLVEAEGRLKHVQDMVARFGADLEAIG